MRARYLLSAIAFVSMCAFATSYEYKAAGVTGAVFRSTIQAACQDAADNFIATNPPGRYSLGVVAAGGSGSSPTCTFSVHDIPFNDDSDIGATIDVQEVSSSSSSSSSSNPCASKTGQSIDGVVSGGAQSAGHNMCSNDGCVVTISSNAINVIGNCPGGMCAIQTGTYSGAQCSFGSTTSADQTSPGNCVHDAAGNTVCSEHRTNGTNCGTVNGDEVCVTTAAPNSCVSYASGGVACNASTTPPVPNNGTTGVPATPTASVQDQASGNTTNYYSSTTVGGSTTTVVTNSGGASAPSGGASSSAGSSGSGTGPSASNGDCGATGVDCSSSGDATLPSLARGDSVQSLTQAFMSGVENSTLITSLNAISTSVPTGTCPSASFDVFGHSYDFMTSGCAMWETHIAPTLEAIMSIVWSVIAVMLVLTA